MFEITHKDEEQLSRKYSERKFREVIDLTNTLLLDIPDTDENVEWKLKVLLYKYESHAFFGESQAALAATSQFEELLSKGPTISDFVKAYTYAALGNQQLQFADSEKGIANLNTALSLINEVDHSRLCCTIYISLGNFYKTALEFDKAIRSYEKITEISKRVNNINYIAHSHVFIGMIESEIGHYEEAFYHYHTAINLYQEIHSEMDLTSVYNNLANVYKTLGDYENALEYFGKGLELSTKYNKEKTLAAIYINMGAIHLSLQEIETALEYFRQSYTINERLGNPNLIAHSNMCIGRCFSMMADFTLAEQHYERGIEIFKRLNDKYEKVDSDVILAQHYFLKNDFDKTIDLLTSSLDFFTENEISMKRSEILHLLARASYKKDQSISSAEYSLQLLDEALHLAEEKQLKNQVSDILNSISEMHSNIQQWEMAFQYSRKHQMMESEIHSASVRKQAEMFNWNRKMAEKEKQYLIEKAQAQEQRKLLNNMLPTEIAERILTGETTIADENTSVTVLFSDIVGFTTISKELEPIELVKHLNEFFSKYDEYADKYGIEKIKTIGDAYMAVCGISKHKHDHAIQMSEFAKEILEYSKTFQFKNHPISIRIGLHTGRVVSGVIGLNKYSYDLWGDTVNMASRLESTAMPNCIHVSESFVDVLTQQSGNRPAVTDNGITQLKNTGSMQTFLLT
ncbi:tetratricopeptide repeat protein [bacterium]|nr:tetratricopeptide repeat protein [bacterium]